VHIDKDDLYRGLQGGELGVGATEGVVALAHEDAALQIDHGDGDAADFADPSAFARNARGVIRWSQQSRLFINVFEDFLLVEDVIAGGHHVDSGGEQVFGYSRRDRKTGGSVLDVRDHEINFALRAQVVEPFFEYTPTGSGYRVTGHQNPYHYLPAFPSPALFIELSK